MAFCPINQTKLLVRKSDVAHASSPFYHIFSTNDLVMAESVDGSGFRLKEPFASALIWALEKVHEAIKESGDFNTESLTTMSREGGEPTTDKFSYFSLFIPEILRLNYLVDTVIPNPLLLAYPTVEKLCSIVEDLQGIGRKAVDWESKANRVLREMEGIFGGKDAEWNRERFTLFGIGDFGGEPTAKGWGEMVLHPEASYYMKANPHHKPWSGEELIANGYTRNDNLGGRVK